MELAKLILSSINVLLAIAIATSQILLFKRVKDYEVLSNAKLEASKELFTRQLNSFDKVLEYMNNLEFYRLQIIKMDPDDKSVSSYIESMNRYLFDLNELYINKNHYFKSVINKSLKSFIDDFKILLYKLKSTVDESDSINELNHSIFKLYVKISVEMKLELNDINVLHNDTEHIHFIDDPKNN